MLTLAWVATYAIWCGCSAWTEHAAEGAANFLECALGPNSSSLLTLWRVPAEFDADEAVDHVLDAPNIWTDGSLVLDEVSGASSSGSGFFAHLPGIHWLSCRWRHLDDSGHDGGGVRLEGFFALFLGLFRPFRGLSSGVLFLPCRLRMFILVLITCDSACWSIGGWGSGFRSC